MTCPTHLINIHIYNILPHAEHLLVHYRFSTLIRCTRFARYYMSTSVKRINGLRVKSNIFLFKICRVRVGKQALT